MTTRSERNSDYRRAGAPMLQDGDPEPMTGASREIRIITAVLLVIMIVAGGLALQFGG